MGKSRPAGRAERARENCVVLFLHLQRYYNELHYRIFPLWDCLGKEQRVLALVVAVFVFPEVISSAFAVERRPKRLCGVEQKERQTEWDRSRWGGELQRNGVRKCAEKIELSKNHHQIELRKPTGSAFKQRVELCFE